MLKLMKGEKGATAILVTASLLLLMGMAAVAIDYGAGLNERRQDQTGADLSALGGAVELSRGQTTQAAVTEITRLVDQNVRATANAAWVACTDPGRLPVTAADLGLTPATQCISFDTFKKIRVRVPNQQTPTVFARVLGAANLTTSAFAETFGQQFPGGGSPPPFAVLGSYSAGQIACLRTSAAGNPGAVIKGNGPGVAASVGVLPADADPCDDSVYPSNTSSFGLLDPYAFFDSAGNIACRQNANDYFIAAGIDHPLGTFANTYVNPYTPGIPVLVDGTGCNFTPESGANTIPIKSGLTAQELRCGLLTRPGVCNASVPGPAGSGLSSPARLQNPGDPSFFPSGQTFVGEEMENKALWEFMARDPGTGLYITAFPGWANNTCRPLAQYLNGVNPITVGGTDYANPGDFEYYDLRDLMIDCMLGWKANGSTEPLFGDDVWDSGRFAFVPYLYETTLDKLAAIPEKPTPCGGNDCIHIQDFVPVWLQTLYTNGMPAPCDDLAGSWGRHHAGQASSCGRSQDNVDRVAAIVLDCAMLPQDVCDARPGPPSTTPGGTVKPIVLLTK